MKEMPVDTDEKCRYFEEYVNEILMVFDTAFQPVYCSPSIERLSGFSPKEFTQRKIDRVFAASSLKALMSLYDEQLSAGPGGGESHAGSIELGLKSRRRSIVPVLGKLRIVWTDDGPSRMVLVLQDIRGQKLMERALLQDAQRYRVFFLKAREPMCITTPQGTIVETNDAWTDLLGYPQEEIVSLNIKTMMPHVMLAYTGPAAISASDSETRLKKRDGSAMTRVVTAVTWASPDHTLLGHLFIVRA